MPDVVDSAKSTQNGVETLAPPPPEAAGEPPKKLDPLDLLAMENLYVKLEHQKLAMEHLDLQKQVAVERARALAGELEALRSQLSKKYGVPIGRGTVTADGAIVLPGAHA